MKSYLAGDMVSAQEIAKVAAAALVIVEGDNNSRLITGTDTPSSPACSSPKWTVMAKPRVLWPCLFFVPCFIVRHRLWKAQDLAWCPSHTAQPPKLLPFWDFASPCVSLWRQSSDG